MAIEVRCLRKNINRQVCQMKNISCARLEANAALCAVSSYVQAACCSALFGTQKTILMQSTRFLHQTALAPNSFHAIIFLHKKRITPNNSCTKHFLCQILPDHFYTSYTKQLLQGTLTTLSPHKFYTRRQERK